MNKYYRKKRKKITKISNLQGWKSYNNSSTLNVALSDLTFVTDRVARKPNKSEIACRAL